MVPGHKVIDRVDKLGEGADGFRIDERVGVGWIHSSTGAADENLDGELCATGHDVHGGYAEYMSVPEAYA